MKLAYYFIFFFLTSNSLYAPLITFSRYTKGNLEVLTYGESHEDDQSQRIFLEQELEKRNQNNAQNSSHLMIEDIATDPETTCIASTGFLPGLINHLNRFQSNNLNIENIENRKITALALYLFNPFLDSNLPDSAVHLHSYTFNLLFQELQQHRIQCLGLLGSLKPEDCSSWLQKDINTILATLQTTYAALIQWLKDRVIKPEDSIADQAQRLSKENNAYYQKREFCTLLLKYSDHLFELPVALRILQNNKNEHKTIALFAGNHHTTSIGNLLLNGGFQCKELSESFTPSHLAYLSNNP